MVLYIHVYIRVEKFVRNRHGRKFVNILRYYVIFREFRNFPEIPVFYCDVNLNTREMLCNLQLEKMFNVREQFP